MKITIREFDNGDENLWLKVLSIVFMPLLVAFVLIVLVWIGILSILGIKKEETADVLFENHQFKIIKKSIYRRKEKKYQIYNDFAFEMSEYGNDVEVFQAFDEKSLTGLNEMLITDFSMETDTQIFLQKISEENDDIRTFLIVFSKETGKVEVVQELGYMILEYFDEKRSTIIGFNDKNRVELIIE